MEVYTPVARVSDVWLSEASEAFDFLLTPTQVLSTVFTIHKNPDQQEQPGRKVSKSLFSFPSLFLLMIL